MSDAEAARPVLLRRPAGGRARRVGRRPVGRRAAGRLGRRRHQGRGPHRRPDAQRVRVARHRRRHAQPGLRPRQPGQAQRGPRPARRRRPAAPRGAAGHGRRLRQQPPARRPRQARPRARTPPWPAIPASCTAASAATASGARSATARPTTSAPSGPGRACPCRWPTPTATRSTPGAASATTSPAWPRWPASWPRSSSSARPARAGWSRSSLLRTGAYVLGWDLGLQMTLGKVAGAEPRHRNQAPLMNPYRTGRRAVVLLHRARGRRATSPAVLPSPRPARPARGRALRQRRRPSASNRTEVIALLDEIIAERPLAEWAERSTARACGGRRPRRRPRSSRTRS